ncbi:polyribonucleotide nucleotidyltransferase, partial [Staphylococcus aureus]|nr:polyribonucleotide nucleotidyltransferase [Staphylococcus aureus]
MIGSSMALSVSDIPFQGPIAGVNVGYIDGKYIINPTVEEKEVSRLDLEVAGHKDAVNMVEAGASEITEQEMLEAIFFGHEEIQRLVDFQQQIVDHIQPVKQEFIPAERDEALVERIKSLTEEKGLKETVLTFDKQQRDEKIRPDGRKPDEIRPLDSEVGILPRTHGSGLFTRGQTQALSVLTLGALGDYQLIDGLGP